MIDEADTTPVLFSPLHEQNVNLGARMVGFAGWEMPLFYTGILDEVRSVRDRCGLFDVSHMGRIEVVGGGAEVLLQWLTTNDVMLLEDGRGQYSLILRPDGGIMDDIILYRRTAESFLLVVNAINRVKLLEWMGENIQADAEIRDVTRNTAQMALQGPAFEHVARVADLPVPPSRFCVSECQVLGEMLEIVRTGYTGEDGIEIILSSEMAGQVWDRILKGGAAPVGLGARDTLRLEAAYCLYGHELTGQVRPQEAGLGRFVKMNKGDFVGRSALQSFNAVNTRKLVGLEMAERSVSRQGQVVMLNGVPVGEITSGTFSPTLERSIAMAYLKSEVAIAGQEIDVLAGSRLRKGVVRPLPFYRCSR